MELRGKGTNTFEKGEEGSVDKSKCRGQNKPLWRDLQDSLALGDRLQPGLAGLWRPPGLRERQVWGRLGKGAHCHEGPPVACAA